MPTLDRTLRRQLASTVGRARSIAEEGAADAIRRLGVTGDVAPGYFSVAELHLRARLIAHAQTLGDAPGGGDPDSARHLKDKAAFEHWHRMLFGRFLVERDLLIHPEYKVSIARADLKEMAAEEGLHDEWALVERIAAPALPAVFKPDDPVLALKLAPEHAVPLRAAVSDLPADVFAADDALGWTYQFWQAAEKDRVKAAGGKIGADELPVVTQLFTEPYMVRFLLHNTLGAWHAGHVLAADPALATGAADEAALRAACALPGYEWEFLRFVQEDGVWRPAAGCFPGWPGTAAALTVLDPCCGSGHFLTEALAALAALRAAEERLSPADAVAAVLRDNLHGLEIDGRCVQIAAFALALMAWRIGGGPAPLPVPHVAWVGAPPPLPKPAFMDLANGDAELRAGLGALHDLFVQAPLLGSLLEVTGGDLLDPGRMARIDRRMDALVERMRRSEPVRAEGALAARGMADAAAILARRFVMQVTNVPFLGRSRQPTAMALHLSDRFFYAKSDLATSMLKHMTDAVADGGTVAAVLPQNWWFLETYKAFRKELLTHHSLRVAAHLGGSSFQTPMYFLNICLMAITSIGKGGPSNFCGFDVGDAPDAEAKQLLLRTVTPITLDQSRSIQSPDYRLSLSARGTDKPLSAYAVALNGLHGADSLRFRHYFWEHEVGSRWRFLQATLSMSEHFSGREHVFYWKDDGLLHRENPLARIQGFGGWGRDGVAVSMMGDLAVTRYHGNLFDISCSPIIPNDPAHLAAIWTFCSSSDYAVAVRQIDQALKVTNATLAKVPFDLAHWTAVAAEKYPNGLPEPYSDDPTQWLFHGHPAHAEPGTNLHVALGRLAGYRWPAENDTAMRLDPLARERIAQAATLPGASTDGLLTLHAYGADRALADRLRTLLGAAFGTPLTPEREHELVRAADAKEGKTARDLSLEGWLANRAFRQHAALFGNRPFVWHIWDGLPGGFSVFVHYHRFGRALLDKLIYTTLGDWIAQATAAGDSVRAEAAGRLRQSLIAIAAGEKPLDIFVRWKPLARQPVGWDPDLDDGVRLNIRPWMTAGVLRDQPRGIAWGKDRGTDVASAPWFDLGPDYGEKPGRRINDHHTTLAEKQAARAGVAP